MLELDTRSGTSRASENESRDPSASMKSFIPKDVVDASGDAGSGGRNSEKRSNETHKQDRRRCHALSQGCTVAGPHSEHGHQSLAILPRVVALPNPWISLALLTGRP